MKSRLAALAALAVLAMPAAAATIGFTPLASPYPIKDAGNPYVEGSFSFTNSDTGYGAMFSWGEPFSDWSADPTGGTLNQYATTTTVARGDGGLFSFVSVDLTDLRNGSAPGPDTQVQFAFTDALGTTYQTVAADSLAGFQTFNFNRTNLLSVAFTPLDGYNALQTDNLVLYAGKPLAAVGFDTLAGPGGVVFAGNPFVEAGFSFTNSHTLGTSLISWGAEFAHYSADPAGGTLNTVYGDTTTTVTRVGGGRFDFIAVDLTEFTNSFGHQPGGDVQFAFTDAVGTTFQTVSVDDLAGFQTFNFNRTGLLSFSFTGLGERAQLQTDNFLFLATVPEPASWALLIAGFGMVGGALRQRRKVALAA